MDPIYDLVIIGSGPAGLSAGIYAARAMLHFIVLEKTGMSGGQIINTYEVDNYPGIEKVNGYDLATKFREHCESLQVPFQTEEGTSIEVLEDGRKKIKTASGSTYLTKTVLISAGAAPKKLNIPGEDSLSGMGVSYCATCDGAFFRKKTVAVIGGGDVALEDAIFLSRICEKVYLIHRRDEFRAAKTLVEKMKQQSNIEFLPFYQVKEIKGQGAVSALQLYQVQKEEFLELSVQGVFIAVGTLPDSLPYRELLDTDENGYLIADESCETKIPGIFVAGDIRTKQLRQVITAAADGANAITSVERYLYSN